VSLADSPDNNLYIVNAEQASDQERLAAREIRRYMYLRTGKLVPIIDILPSAGNVIQIGMDKSLEQQQYRLTTVTEKDRKVLHINGGSPVAVLYGAYHFVEKLGIRFYLHGDVIPDEKISFQFPDLDEIHTPLFAKRGIQPFHDFTEGPDWWTLDDYKTYLSQMAKMRMNWIGFHCYPEGGVGPEPLVWIGLPEDIKEDGTVKNSYPSRWASTIGGSWGYEKTKTSEFAAGASLLFPDDDFGSPVTNGFRPIPKTGKASNTVFNRAGNFLNEAFTHGKSLGINIVVGTETPLTIPSTVQKNLKKRGLNPSDPNVVKKLYEGMFSRISKTYPIDYYWLWTPEGWTWSGTKQEQVEATIQDINLALDALNTVGKPFGLATCGWVLGPPNDRSLFDKVLPKEVAISCINRNLGFEWVEPGFANIKDRPQWAIPWMEDDPAMIIPQLWVGRMRKDAADALAYGCTGLMGIHWRTRVLAPNVSALAQAAWDQKKWNPDFGKPYIPPEHPDIEGAIDGRYADFNGVPVAGTESDTVYQTMVYSMENYYLQLSEGDYDLTLQFCELYHKEKGKRIFNVEVQGNILLNEFDIFKEAGFGKALDKTFKRIKVVDGKLNLKFTRMADNPSLAGIIISETTSGTFVRKINCGGNKYRDYDADPGFLNSKKEITRDLAVDDFYRDWALAEFGAEVSQPLAQLFIKLDGGLYTKDINHANLPRPSSWIGGPGGIKVNEKFWEYEKVRYSFFDEMAELRPKVNGAGNLDRFDYWLNSFRYLRAIGEIGCTRGKLDKIMKQIDQTKKDNVKKKLAATALQTRIQLTRQWEKMLTLLLQTVTTPGEMGTVANCEQHVRRNTNAAHFLDLHDEKLKEILGKSLPDIIAPTTNYLGEPRIIVPTQRSQVKVGEQLTIKVILLDNEHLDSAVLNWRPLGQGEYKEIHLKHKARAVYSIILPPAEGDGIEYYIEAIMAGEKKLKWPATAPELNQTVVVL